MLLWWLHPASLIIGASGVVMLQVVTIPATIVSMRCHHDIAWLTVLVSASSVDQLIAWRRRPWGDGGGTVDNRHQADWVTQQ